MSVAVESFIAYWHMLDTSMPDRALIHPADRSHPKLHECGLALHLLPFPVNGDLRKADIVILMENAGFGVDDELWERANPVAHQRMLRAQLANLRQEHGDSPYPFFDLNPEFCDHPGAAYWKGGARLVRPKKQMAKLSRLADRLALMRGIKRSDALGIFATRIAVIELLPYRSTSLRSRGLLRTVKSCSIARDLAHALVREGEKLIVVTRSTREWGFDVPRLDENLVVYPSALGASASLTENSPGGKAILRRLMLKLGRKEDNAEGTRFA